MLLYQYSMAIEIGNNYPSDVPSSASEIRTGTGSLHGRAGKGISALTAGFLAVSCSPAREVVEEAPPFVPAAVEISCLSDSPLPKVQETFCMERREGTLGIVALPGLDTVPGNAFPEVSDLQSAGEYATEVLHKISDGAIDLDVEVIVAPAEVAEAIEERNFGFKIGKDCVSLGDPENTMGAVVDDLMPELDETYSQVAVYGGDSCDSEPDESYTVGRSAYDKDSQFSDIYSDSALHTYVNPQASDTLAPFAEEVGETIAHEVAHNYRVGHALSMIIPEEQQQLEQQSVTDPVDLDAYYRNTESYYEYGELSNLMGANTAALGSEYEADLVNVNQQSYIQEGSYAGLLPEQQIVVPVTHGDTVEIQQDGVTQGIRLPLETPFKLGTYELTEIAFAPQFANGYTNVNVWLTTGRDDELFATAEVGYFFVPHYDGLVLHSGNNQITIADLEDWSGVSISVGPKTS
jgi:hypothetical protein